MKRSSFVLPGLLIAAATALPLALANNALAQQLTNADFNAESGTWQDGAGPPGWELSLDRDDQFGIVEDIDFASSGERAFYYSGLGRGFGDARMDQCVVLDQAFDALMLSVHVLTDEPDPELALRLRVDFYADEACDEDSANAGDERIGTDVGLSEERVAPGEWTRIESQTRLASELGEDVRSARVSLRVRDRSDEGQPRDPARIVWLDAVSLEADVVFVPPEQRAALRELYTATDGPNWTESLGWLDAEGTECSWHGVTCGADGDTVVGLNLSGNALLGELPESITALTDLIPGEGLDLCWNEILITDELAEFIDSVHLGGDPGFCQGVELLPFSRERTGNYYQPDGRDGEGFSLNMLGAGAAVLYWATYDDAGQPLWLFGSGRADGRVLRVPDLYVTDRRGDAVTVERVGRASLVLTSTEDQPDCRQALLRFSAEGDGFAAMDGRELITLDAEAACGETGPADPLLADLAGLWFDPDLDGQGLTFTVYAADQLILNWFGYDEDGGQVWRIGAGRAAGTDSIRFDELLAVRGGSFNGPISPDGLDFEAGGNALLTRTETGWEFDLLEPDGRMTRLALQPLEAGPDLLASTGRRIDLEMAPEDLAELYRRSPFSNDRLPGQVRFDGSDQVQALTGLRFRGSSSRFLPKKAFNIRFENPQPLLFGSDRMNLNAMYTDPTMLREALSFELFHTLDQPAPATRYFDLWINDIYEGTYLHIQRVDETLLEQNGLNPDGTLVRDEFRDNSDLARSAFGHDFSGLDSEARLTLLIDNFNHRGDPKWEILLELIDWVQATPAGADFAEGLDDRLDLANFTDWLALHWLIGDIDSFGDDYWLYLDHEDPDARWHVIPWDKDLAFGSHFRSGIGTDNAFFAYEYPLRGGWDNLLIERFLDSPTLAERVQVRLEELITETFPTDWFSERLDSLAEKLEDSVAITRGPLAFGQHPQNHFGVLGRFHDQVESILDFIELRYRFISRQLEDRGDLIDEASEILSAGSVGKIFLTDDSGFSLAGLEPLSAATEDNLVTIRVEAAVEAIQGIDRTWVLDIERPIPDLRLSLFYRNDVANFGRPGNWYTGGDVPIGRQDELMLHIRSADGSATTVNTRVNPYSNKAVADLSGLAPGRHELELRLPAEN